MDKLIDDLLNVVNPSQGLLSAHVGFGSKPLRMTISKSSEVMPSSSKPLMQQDTFRPCLRA